MDWLTFSIVIALLLVSAFFSASETALTGASRASVLRLSKQGNREAGVVSSLFAMRERMIGALLLGNNIANIGASALATGIFTAWFGEVGVLYATGVMTVMVVIFAEVLPKTIAINAPDRVSARRGRSAPSRRQGRKAGPRHVRRAPGSERAAGLRRHGSSHRNGDDQRRPAARGTRARDAGHRIYQDSAVARKAGKYHRRAACQGSAARDPRRRRRYLQDRRLDDRAAAMVRAGDASGIRTAQ